MCRNNGFNDVFNYVLANLLLIDVGSVLSRDDYGIGSYRLPVLVLYRNLAFAIRAQVSHRTAATPGGTTHQRELAHQFMSQAMVMGIYSGVSLQAKPIIIPW